MKRKKSFDQLSLKKKAGQKGKPPKAFRTKAFGGFMLGSINKGKQGLARIYPGSAKLN